jgi:putative ABC transport system permease protein
LVVILSKGLWRERYQSSPAVLGTPLVIDGRAHTIIGVAPDRFEFPERRVRLWVPYMIPRSTTAASGAVVFTALGRMMPGVTVSQVEAEGTAAARSAPRHRLTEFFFGKGGPVVVHARALVDDMAAPARPAVSMLAVAVAMVLIIACANVTNLLLSRGVSRQRELAIRAALGGSRWRIIRQLLTESAVLAVLGSAVGLVLAWWLVHALPILAPAQLPRLDAVRLDGRVGLFWLVATLLGMIAAALPPALRGGRVHLSDALTTAARSSDTEFRDTSARRLRDGLLIVETAFAVVLIIGASLLARSFFRLVHVDNGYNADDVLLVSVALPRETPQARTNQFIETTLERLRTISGVSAVGAGEEAPLTPKTAIVPFTLPAALSGGKPNQGRTVANWVTPGYAEALGLRLREGRFFDGADQGAGVLPILVNQEFVRRHLVVHPVVGTRIPNLLGAGHDSVAEVVGVVGNVLKDGNDRGAQPEVYFMHGSRSQYIGGSVNFVLRARGDLEALVPAIRSVVRQIDRQVVIDRVEPLSRVLGASFGTPRFAAAVVGAFAMVAMLLAAVGLYGVLSYRVSQCVRELAIRAALGARRRDLVHLVLRQGLIVTSIGIAVGMLSAILMTRLMQDLLFGVTSHDRVTFAVAPALVLAVCLAASVPPVWRAASIDPAELLRA